MKIKVSVIIIVFLLICSGCWNNRDLTDLAIVSGMGLDLCEDGKTELTVQVIKGSSMKTEGSTGHEQAYTIVSAKGETTFEAVRNLISRINKKAFFAHTRLIILSEDYAREGVYQFIDFYERDNETRRRSDVIIAKNIKAKEVLNINSDLEKIPAVKIVETLQSSNSLSKSLKTRFIDILKHYSHKGHALVVPIIYPIKDKVERQKDLDIEGSAILKEGKFVGYLDPYQTRGYLFADNKVQSSIIVIPSPADNEKLVAVEVIRSDGKVSANIKDNKISFNIEIEAEGNLGEQLDDNDLTKEDMIKGIEKNVEEKIKSEIESAINISQKEYNADIFGFVNEIYQNHFSYWEKNINDWDYIYSSTPVNIKVKFDLRRTGTIRGPIKPIEKE